MRIRILKMIASSGFLTAAPNSILTGALPRTLLESLQHSPRPSGWIKGTYGEGRERRGQGELGRGRGGTGNGGMEGKG